MVGSEYGDVHHAFSNSERRLDDAEDLPWAFSAAHIVVLHRGTLSDQGHDGCGLARRQGAPGPGSSSCQRSYSRPQIPQQGSATPSDHSKNHKKLFGNEENFTMPLLRGAKHVILGWMLW